MSSRLREREEKLQELIVQLTTEAAKGTPLLVEGKKDADALKILGISGKVLTLKTGGKSFLDVISEIEQTGSGRVILFLDFDRRGKEATRRLKVELERLKIVPDQTFWLQLFRLAGKEIRCIESLPSYLQTLHNKTQS
ncbi:MAG: toprim domain-containing protein [Candidatus Bathyarchaeota archaeon]|nr:toprim domain-containing protein [Candidatus Bathyarchaeota archaeon]